MIFDKISTFSYLALLPKNFRCEIFVQRLLRRDIECWVAGTALATLKRIEDCKFSNLPKEKFPLKIEFFHEPDMPPKCSADSVLHGAARAAALAAEPGVSAPNLGRNQLTLKLGPEFSFKTFFEPKFARFW